MSKSLRKLLVFSLVGFGVFCFLKGLPSSVTRKAADGLMSDAVASVHSELLAAPSPSSVKTQAIETTKSASEFWRRTGEQSSAVLGRVIPGGGRQILVLGVRRGDIIRPRTVE